MDGKTPVQGELELKALKPVAGSPTATAAVEGIITKEVKPVLVQADVEFKAAEKKGAVSYDPQKFLKDITDDVKESKCLLKLHPNETIETGLARLAEQFEDRNLVSTSPGSCMCCTSTTILKGQIGCATKNGQTHFIPPGNYAFLGPGTVLHKVVDVENEDKAGTLLDWKDVSYICLPENHIAVVQMGDEQKCFGSGRYIFRRPVILAGIVDIQNLSTRLHSTAYTEQVDIKSSGYRLGRPKEVLVAQKIPSGTFEKCGSLTFIRPEPGFAYVIQDAKGMLQSGSKFKIARGGEKFKEFVDLQHHSRTTRMFLVESKDRQEVRVRAQIRWKIVQPLEWVQRKGTSHDIFEAIEETIQALLRDSISSCTYEDCRIEAGNGFQGFETKMKPKLVAHINSLGGFMLGFEVREVRFPLLEQHNKIRAKKEAEKKEKLLEEKRAREIDEAKRVRQQQDITFTMDQQRKEEEHKTHMMKLRKDVEFKREDLGSKVDLLKTDCETTVNKIKLEGRKLAQETENRIENMKAEEKAKRDLYREEGSAKKELILAKAEAEASMTMSAAKAQAKILIAKAQARAAELMGAAFKENPGYVQYRITQLNASVLKQRADALDKALISNRGALMPASIQKDQMLVQAGFSPVPPVAFKDGGILTPETVSLDTFKRFADKKTKK